MDVFSIVLFGIIAFIAAFLAVLSTNRFAEKLPVTGRGNQRRTLLGVERRYEFAGITGAGIDSPDKEVSHAFMFAGVADKRRNQHLLPSHLRVGQRLIRLSSRFGSGTAAGRTEQSADAAAAGSSRRSAP